MQVLRGRDVFHMCSASCGQRLRCQGAGPSLRLPSLREETPLHEDDVDFWVAIIAGALRRACGPGEMRPLELGTLGQGRFESPCKADLSLRPLGFPSPSDCESLVNPFSEVLLCVLLHDVRPVLENSQRFDIARRSLVDSTRACDYFQSATLQDISELKHKAA